MKLTDNEKAFIKDHREVLSALFQKRVEDLKEEMLQEDDEKERNKIRELVLEFKRWLRDVKITTEEKEIKKDTGV